MEGDQYTDGARPVGPWKVEANNLIQIIPATRKRVMPWRPGRAWKNIYIL